MKKKQLKWLSIALPFTLMGCSSVHTELTVPASPEEIWQVLTDASAYPDWNPTIVKIDGDFVTGATIQNHLKEPSGKISVLKTKVKAIKTAEHLNQGGGIPGILTFDHHFHLKPVAGGTRIIQHEDYRGIGVLFWNSDWVEPAYAEVNAALQDRVLALRDAQ